MTKRWRESKKEKAQKGEREVMTCSNYEDCLLEIPEREKEGERGAEREVVEGEKYSEHEGQQQRWEKKNVKI